MTAQSKSKFCPSYLNDEDDLVHPIADVPLWSENYLSHANFPDAGIYFWLHQGRTVYDPEIWQEIFVAYLPGEQYLVSKANSPACTRQGPRPAGLIYECVKPFEEWNKRFHGAARLVSGDDLRAGALPDGRGIGVKMDLNWRALGPAFDMDLSQQVWTTNHYEQHCNISGHLEYDGKRIELKGTGLRDHSWGPRDYSRLGRHIWAHAQWPDGRAFMIFHLVSPDGSHTLSHVSVDDGTGNVQAKLLNEAPLINHSMLEGSQGYRLSFELPNGSIVHIDAEEIFAMPIISCTGQAELVLGADRSADTSHWLCEGATRFNWGGTIAHGLTERLVHRKKK